MSLLRELFGLADPAVEEADGASVHELRRRTG
jgi:hypothetical protein